MKWKLTFSTLGCPNWDLYDIANAVRTFGYDGVELRALAGDLELLGRPEFQPGELATTRRWLADQSITVCCVDTSCTFHSRTASERSAQVVVALKHSELAAALGAPLIRVFPDKIQEGASRGETRSYIATALREIAERLPGGVRVGLETHGDFARGELAAEIVELAAHPGVCIVWDVANSLAAGDSIAAAARAVSPYLSHVHLRDARSVKDSEQWLPVLAGQGNVSFAATIAALEKINYSGYISFEWEKYWHPEIEAPEIALPDFMNAMNGLIRNDTLLR
ncbi:MAG: sugar phosphate isomerase/epimerase family protein [Pyrinomonadaceae bacterium]